MLIQLNQSEINELFKQDPDTKSDGGYQRLLVNFQERIDSSNSTLDLTTNDLEKIPRYAFDYGQGGWEDRLRKIFERHLGSDLGR